MGSRISASVDFSYDPPYVEYVTPNTPNANGDTLEINGHNFAESIDDAGAIALTIGGLPCEPVQVGDVAASIWQVNADNEPYLWCQTGKMTVGPKPIVVEIAGQNVTFEKEDDRVSMQCAYGYYGQEEWRAWTGLDGQCRYHCSDESEACMEMGSWNEETGEHDVEGCKEQHFCTGHTSFFDDIQTNCTALTPQDEFCVECPPGSICGTPSIIYPVEPDSLEGYYRLSDPATEEVCEPDRLHRTECYR